jgi:hypothetical protein
MLKPIATPKWSKWSRVPGSREVVTFLDIDTPECRFAGIQKAVSIRPLICTPVEYKWKVRAAIADMETFLDQYGYERPKTWPDPPTLSEARACLA